ncbi:MAG TPA: carboxypeptidase-like regulatory domain-containing protein [Blastocatellia bacterium]|nr:carboxypeptidase-like regulatory domain-containing protein [Blastocatellia bacterium]
MIRQRRLPGELMEMYSPIGLLPRDIFTKRSPVGEIRATLEIDAGNGGWRKTEIGATRTPGGVIAYPGLGRRARVAGQPAQRYRVRLQMAAYEPHYRRAHSGEPLGIIKRTADGIEFDVFPYNDENPPQNFAQLSNLWEVWFAPAPNYQFPDHVPILRGQVTDPTGRAVAGAEVSWQTNQQAMTGENGTFGLPLLISKSLDLTTPQLIAATDFRGHTGTITIMIPQAVGKNQIIIIS